MKRLVLAAAITVAVLPAKADEYPQTGNLLLKACESAATNKTDWFSGYCLGLAHGVTLVAEQRALACLTGDVTTGQTVRVILKYLQDHPQDLNYDSAVLAAYAIQQAWPCPTKKKP